ncbi:MAG TPA: transcription elongation factor GreA [Armatimonadaceae bacterium]|nr:transcription elongation factor GreA [Armatimonadaceae bacterium]
MEQEDEIVLTASGLESIEEELRRLVTVERPEVANRIRDAKDYGDLTENAEYEAAKNAQAFVEGRILDLKRILASARVLNDEDVRTDVVSIGSTVTVRDLEFGDDWTLTLVSPYEADPDNDRISDLSPVGKALLGHQVGEKVTVQTPGGTTQYEISSISK